MRCLFPILNRLVRARTENTAADGGYFSRKIWLNGRDGRSTRYQIFPGISSFFLLNFPFICDFFTIQLFSRERSFPIFLKIWCNSSRKLGMFQVKNLALKNRCIGYWFWKIQENYQLEVNKVNKSVFRQCFVK